MPAYKYVVIGGGIAGGRTCEGIRRIDGEGTVALVAGEAHRPYQRPPLSKGYLAGREDLDSVYLRPEGYYADQGVDLFVGVRALALDPAAHSVQLADGQELGYEKVCLATGARARRLEVPGVRLPNVFTLRKIEDADRIGDAASSASSALVVGGSFIGSEVAASLAQLGLGVSMAFPESRLLERVVPESLGGLIHTKYAENGIRILPGTTPEHFEGRGTIERAVLADGTVLDIDLVVLGVGVELDTGLAADAGLALSDRGAIVVDEYLRTSAPDVYAAGDIAAWPDPTYGARLRVEHWDVARAQGLRAGRNMAGEDKPYTALPYFFSDLFDLSFEVWGNLARWDDTVLRGSLDSGSYAIYYFDEGLLTGVLAVERPDDERKPMQEIVRRRPRYDDVARQLGDESLALSTL